MGDACGHLSKRCKVFLQLDPVVQFDDLRQVGKQTDSTLDFASVVLDGGEIDADALIHFGPDRRVKFDARENFSGSQTAVQKVLQDLRLANEIAQPRIALEG